MRDPDWVNSAGQLFVLAGLVFAVRKFSLQKRREFQKRFYEQQLATFTEAVDIAAFITQLEEIEPEYQAAVRSFRRLYWGKMCLVEDRAVEKAMVRFNNLLDLYEDSKDIATTES